MCAVDRVSPNSPCVLDCLLVSFQLSAVSNHSCTLRNSLREINWLPASKLEEEVEAALRRVAGCAINRFAMKTNQTS